MSKRMTKHTMKETLHQWLVFFVPISVSNFHFQFPFPVSISSFRFISISCFSICPIDNTVLSMPPGSLVPRPHPSPHGWGLGTRLPPGGVYTLIMNGHKQSNASMPEVHFLLPCPVIREPFSPTPWSVNHSAPPPQFLAENITRIVPKRWAYRTSWRIEQTDQQLCKTEAKHPSESTCCSRCIAKFIIVGHVRCYWCITVLA